MSRIVDLLVRLVVILAAYVVAAMAASAFLHVVVWPLLFSADEMPGAVLGGVVFSIPFIALFVAYFAFLPFVVLAGLAEVLGLRSWLYYAPAGAVSGLVVVMLFQGYGVPEDVSGVPEGMADMTSFSMSPEAMLAVFAAGLVAGIAYWLVAGRNAGLWLERYPPRRGPSGPGPSGS